ncbi:esterase family protein [Paucisalibacillus sp. EB02]|uniref:alpha/beta hydrolase n=1 Tax=Paucisalibacillus sp. EB02 TaxID=1347087 RepID=UPI0004ADC675|nr:alpha/beta hydrolase-fold protein [Paucisalibacillus sp. EB02]
MALIKHVFPSQILERDFEYYILSSHTPTEETYLLYVQDGQDYLELGSIEYTFQRLIEAKPEIANKLILVLIHPGDSMARWNAYHHKGKDFKQYISFMTKEFIPSVEEKLESKITKRGLLGDSLAANISLNIAVENPANWTHLLLQSAAVSPTDVQQIENTEQLNWNVHQTVGLKEDEFVSLITNEPLYILTRNRMLHQKLIEKNARVHYAEKDSKHEWVFWENELVNVLDYFVSN